jgi:hypothetical protein
MLEDYLVGNFLDGWNNFDPLISSYDNNFFGLAGHTEFPFFFSAVILEFNTEVCTRD